MENTATTDIFTLRKAETADIPRLAEMINRCYRGEASKKGWTTEADLIAGDLRTDEADLTKLMANDAACIVTCSHAEAGIVGCVYLEKKGERLYLGMLSVDLDWQASGIGKRLLMATEAHAISLGCKAIFMQVISARTSLIDWYSRYGYQPTGERMPFDVDTKFGVPKVPLEFWIYEKKMGEDLAI